MRRDGLPTRRPSRRLGGFNPATDIGGLALWLRADLGITLNTTQVSAWADQSGAGRHFSQASGPAQPTFIASETDFPSAKPAVKFDIAGCSLDGPDKVAVRYVAIVGVYGAATFSAFHTAVGSTTQTDPAERRFFTGNNATANWLTTAAPASTATIYKDGAATSVALTTANTPHFWELTWAADVQPSTAWRIGNDHSATRNWTDSIAEIILATAIPNAATLTALRAYVSARYGFAT